MIRFEDTSFAVYFVICLVVVVLYFWSRYLRKRWMTALGQSPKIEQITDRTYPRQQVWKTVLVTLAMVVAVLALINPQRGRKKQKVSVTNTDVVIALDLSRSMLCEDIKPSRLERSRLLTSRLIDQLRGERIGLVVFAGEAFVQVPLTMDYASLELFVQNAHPDQIDYQSSNLSAAIRRAISVFPSDDKRPGTIVMITDGEDLHKDSLQAAQQAYALDYPLYVIGVGTPQGGTIPTSTGAHRDHTGQIVTTRLDAERLTSLARAGGGRSYSIAQNAQAVSDIVDHVQSVEKTESEQLSFSEYVSYYPVFLGLCLLLLIFDFTMPFGKKITLYSSQT